MFNNKIFIRRLFPFIAASVFCALLFSSCRNYSENQMPNGSPAPSPASTTVRLFFDSSSPIDVLPTHSVRSFVSPHRLEISLYNVINPDIDALLKTFTELPIVKDCYRTILLDDSRISFTVEFNQSVSYETSEYNPDGFIDLTITPDSITDSPVWIIRCPSSEMNESLALLCERISEFTPSIVKTQTNEFCVTVGPFSTYNEANDVLSLFADNTFYIEQLTGNENPK